MEWELVEKTDDVVVKECRPDERTVLRATNHQIGYRTGEWMWQTIREGRVISQSIIPIGFFRIARQQAEQDYRLRQSVGLWV